MYFIDNIIVHCMCDELRYIHVDYLDFIVYIDYLNCIAIFDINCNCRIEILII